jgi:hypothetical protein
MFFVSFTLQIKEEFSPWPANLTLYLVCVILIFVNVLPVFGRVKIFSDL